MNASNGKERIGIVGAGRMGLAMLKHLVRHGYEVTACDLDAGQIAKARAAGAASAPHPAALAKSATFVILGVGYTDEVNAVVHGEKRASGCAPGRIDHRDLLDRVSHDRAGDRCGRKAERHRDARCPDLPRTLGGR
jgi:lactate dehydrogenase-like 2-hydroxyacid dehydrogenase